MQTLANYFPIKKLADRMSDEEFYEFCLANKHLRIERDEQSNVFIMSPVGSRSGIYESKLIAFLEMWNLEHQLGYVFSSSAGFKLPDTSVRSADAAWLSKAKWDKLSEADKKGFAAVVPEFIIELRSESDHLETLQEKMGKWLENGVELAWLIDPEEQQVWIYRNGQAVEHRQGFERKLAGESILPGFEFDLQVLSGI